MTHNVFFVPTAGKRRGGRQPAIALHRYSSSESSATANSTECVGERVVLFLIHGAGMAAASWEPAVMKLLAHATAPSSPHPSGRVGLSTPVPPLMYDVFAVDLRGHGGSTAEFSTTGKEKEEKSGGAVNPPPTLDTFVDDCMECLKFVLCDLYGWSDPTRKNEKSLLPTAYLVGHSLGGPVAVRLYHTLQAMKTPVSIVAGMEGEKDGTGKCPIILPPLSGLVGGLFMLDIVEGTAKSSLAIQENLFRQRPATFESVPDAIRWCLRHGGMKNEAVLNRTIPPLLVEEQVGRDPGTAAAPTQGGNEEGMKGAVQAETSKRTILAWRTDVSSTAEFWPLWFEGLNAQFLSISCPKVLLLASTNRLDTEMITAQMQGKFQLDIMRDAGHYMYEDDPDGVARRLVAFVERVHRLQVKLKKANAALHHN